MTNFLLTVNQNYHIRTYNNLLNHKPWIFSRVQSNNKCWQPLIHNLLLCFKSKSWLVLWWYTCKTLNFPLNTWFVIYIFAFITQKIIVSTCLTDFGIFSALGVLIFALILFCYLYMSSYNYFDLKNVTFKKLTIRISCKCIISNFIYPV